MDESSYQAHTQEHSGKTYTGFRQMITIPSRRDLLKIVVLNPKGGSGKTTLCTNLASCFALMEGAPALMDCDPQGSSMHWLDKRSPERPAIHGIAAYHFNSRKTRSWQLSVPAEVRQLIVDTPAGLGVRRLCEFTQSADAILVPVLTSDTDIHAASHLMADLLLVAKVSRSSGKLGVIANRVREKTLMYRKLMSFLDSLDIELVTVLRDTQNYVHATDRGLGVHELAPARVRKDISQWQPLLNWIKSRKDPPPKPRGIRLDFAPETQHSNSKHRPH